MEQTARFAARLPDVMAEVDALVDRIARSATRFAPDRLLHRAWWEFAGIAITQGAGKVEETGVLRMIDYVQSVIASIEPDTDASRDLPEADWTQLQADVQSLFKKVTFDYQLCRTAAARQVNPKLGADLEEFRFRAETIWMNVRGKRYQNHERQALEDLMAPHSDELQKLFGIDATTLVGELDKILQKLTRGAAEAMCDLQALHKQSICRLEALAVLGDVKSVDELNDKLWEDTEFAARRDAVAGEVVGLDLFDVEKVTALPKSLIDEMTWAPGEDKDFFGAGDFSGWPLRVWPIMKRPFIRVDGQALCFDMFGLFDNCYRVLQRIIFRLDPAYKNCWNERQKAISEELPFRYLKKLLPAMQQIRSVYYLWSPDSGKAQWHECDGVVIYDDHLFVIEVKGGAFTYTSPATDLQAHLASLKNLLMNPASQGSRFVDYLESATEVSLADADHKEIGRLRRGAFRHVTVLAITLDAFTELAARAQHLRNVGIDVGARHVWPLALDDLRVYVDIFDNPLIFLHFVEQRMRAAASDAVNLNDELDHLGLYVAENNYARFAEGVVGGNKQAELTLNGYRALIDEYYAARLRAEDPAPPRQEMPPRVAEIVANLGRSSANGRSAIASFLLDAGSKLREDIERGINDQLDGNRRLGRARPFSVYGEHGFTLFTWSPAMPRNATMAQDHVRVVAVGAEEHGRFLLELEYDAAERLQAIHWQNVGLAALSGVERTLLEASASSLKRQRVAAALGRGKIAVNDLCPCGSRKKYKKCCKR